MGMPRETVYGWFKRGAQQRPAAMAGEAEWARAPTLVYAWVHGWVMGRVVGGLRVVVWVLPADAFDLRMRCAPLDMHNYVNRMQSMICAICAIPVTALCMV